MKKIILVYISLVFFAFNVYAQQDFNGHWIFETESSAFSLTLNQNTNQLTGYHCSTMFNGNFIDCEVPGEFAMYNGISIIGTIINNVATVTFKSTYCMKSGIAKITKIDNTQIHWKIITKPQGVYYIPDECMLKKQD